MLPRLLVAAGLLLAAAAMADPSPMPAPSGADAARDMPDDFCVTLREANASVPRGHVQLRLRVCAHDRQAELVRVDGYPEVFDQIHRRVVVAPVPEQALHDLYVRVGSWQPGRWQEPWSGDPRERPPRSPLIGSGSCGISVSARDVGWALDCSPGMVQPSSQGERDETVAAIRALVPASGWQEIRQ